MNRIIIYKKTGCPWAAAVEAFLKAKNIPFEVRDIFITPKFQNEVEAATSQNKSPTLNINGKWLSDASVEQVAEAVADF